MKIKALGYDKKNVPLDTSVEKLCKKYTNLKAEYGKIRLHNKWEGSGRNE